MTQHLFFFGVEYICIRHFNDFLEIKPYEANAPSLAFNHQTG